jgi:cytochrome b pre-mRNA-processing protein 3
MLTFFRSKSNPRRIAAEKLYGDLVAQARQPVFYAEWGVPDTVDGRFDMILLHIFAVMRRLSIEGQEEKDLSQALYDVMFVDLDRALREIGVGDMSVGRHIRRMMKAFNGRMIAYEDGLIDAEKMDAALRRNVYGTVAGEISTAKLAAYAHQCVRSVQTMPLQMIVEGRLIWPSMDLQQSA